MKETCTAQAANFFGTSWGTGSTSGGFGLSFFGFSSGITVGGCSGSMVGAGTGFPGLISGLGDGTSVGVF